MKYFIFRNYTVELFFKGLDAGFSGYEDIASIDIFADKYIWFYLSPCEPDSEIASKKIRHYGNLLELLFSRLDSAKQLIICTMTPLFKINYQITDLGIDEAIREYNQKIYLLKKNNVKIIDAGDFFLRYSCEYLIDWKYYYIAQMPINPKLGPDFTRWFMRQMEIVDLKRKKCIIVDLDNTLWGGVLGEDGIEGIKMGESYPGSAFRFFQSYLLNLKRNGIILAVCSKNNEVDVISGWENHPDMLLDRADFVAYRINWNNKADNIQDIAEELNIGLGSIVFIDDSPFERELVKQALTDVCVPDFPEHPYLLPEFAKELTEDYFCAYNLTDEDYSKTEKYIDNKKRVQQEKQFTDIDAYLRSLEMKITIEKLNNLNITRLAQMTQKTNQFNLTTKRYVESDILSFADTCGEVYGLRARDKFGDNGLTGMIMIRINGQIADIDTLLLSCRILGKEIEYVFVNYILAKLKNTGIEKVTATYSKTLKNSQVEDFYDKFGFTVINSTEDYKQYILDLDGREFFISDRYRLEEICAKE
jgi:FkbH-like protein